MASDAVQEAIPLVSRGFPDLRFREFSFGSWIGLSRHVCCEVCREDMGELEVWPVTGRCGHSICILCYRKSDDTTRKERWPCPVPGCEDPSSFDKNDHRKSFTLVRSIVRMDEIEYNAGLHLKRAHADYVNDMYTIRQEHKKNLDVLQEKMKDSEQEMDVLRETIFRLKLDLDGKEKKMNLMEERMMRCKHCSEYSVSSTDAYLVGRKVNAYGGVKVKQTGNSQPSSEPSSSDSSISVRHLSRQKACRGKMAAKTNMKPIETSSSSSNSTSSIQKWSRRKATKRSPKALASLAANRNSPNEQKKKSLDLSSESESSDAEFH